MRLLERLRKYTHIYFDNSPGLFRGKQVVGEKNIEKRKQKVLSLTPEGISQPLGIISQLTE